MCKYSWTYFFEHMPVKWAVKHSSPSLGSNMDISSLCTACPCPMSQDLKEYDSDEHVIRHVPWWSMWNRVGALDSSRLS